MRFCELRDKEVINICDCRKLGHITDLVIEEDKGLIEAIIIPKNGRFCGGLFGDGGEYIIPYKCIKSIGSDIVLVEMRELKDEKK